MDIVITADAPFWSTSIAAQHSSRPRLTEKEFITSAISDLCIIVCTMTIPTPQIGHFTEADYEHIYEPAGVYSQLA